MYSLSYGANDPAPDANGFINFEEDFDSFDLDDFAEGSSGYKKKRASPEQEIFNLLGTETSLRSKRELIEKFILENLPVIEDADEVEPAFDQYWSEEQQKAFKKLVTEENLSPERTEKLIEDYLFAEREPMRDQVLELIEGGHPSLLQRKKLGDRILGKIVGFVETFIDGMRG